jgi:hypothetical protein
VESAPSLLALFLSDPAPEDLFSACSTQSQKKNIDAGHVVRLCVSVCVHVFFWSTSLHCVAVKLPNCHLQLVNNATELLILLG